METETNILTRTSRDPIDTTDSSSYRRDLDTILDSGLTPENIDTYADDALRSLIGLLMRITEDFKKQSDNSFLIGKELEDRACQHFGLGNVESILDHIDSISSRIRRLDNVIARAKSTGEIIVPPDNSENTDILPGLESFEKPGKTPRLKTVLFLLEAEFQLDVSNQSQVIVERGEVNSNMMRKEPYYSIRIPSLNRIVLVCNENGNRTFVFNISLVKESIGESELLRKTKSALSDLIKFRSGVGKSITYSSQSYIGHIVGALRDPLENKADNEKTDTRYLVPVAPEGFLSLSGIRKKFGLDRGTVLKIVEVLKESGELGDVDTYRSGPMRVKCYNPAQQEIIRKHLQEQGFLVPVTPEGFLALNIIRREFGLGSTTVLKVVEELEKSGELGNVCTYKSGYNRVKCYNSAQQEIIRKHLQEQGLLVPVAPEGFLSLYGIYKEYGISSTTVLKVVEELEKSGELGHVGTYRSGSHRAKCYNPDQQEIIRKHLPPKE